MERSELEVIGHVYIEDDLGNVHLDQSNAIHFEDMSLAVAQSLGNKPEGPIRDMVFGNGGATISAINTVTYLEPNTIGASASLHNQTFQKIVDNLNPSNPDPDRNRIEISHTTGFLFSDVIITATLDQGEPSGQDAFDNTNNQEADFVFDELGLVNYGNTLLTHIIFNPIQKSLNRIFLITYTIRIQMV